MNRLEAALVDVAGFLEARRIPWMVFGGWATLRWGRARLTEDIDVKIVLEEARWPGFIAEAGRSFEILVEDGVGFARVTRVIPLRTPTGVRVDVVLAGIPYEEQAIARAHVLDVAGVVVRLCAPEDLVLHKLASERARDREDVESVVLRQAAALDRAYLDPRVRELARGLERPEIEEFYRACLARAGRVP